MKKRMRLKETKALCFPSHFPCAINSQRRATKKFLFFAFASMVPCKCPESADHVLWQERAELLCVLPFCERARAEDRSVSLSGFLQGGQKGLCLFVSGVNHTSDRNPRPYRSKQETKKRFKHASSQSVKLFNHISLSHS